MEMKVGALGLVAIMLSLVASIANAGEGLAVWYKPNDKDVYYPSACYDGDEGRWVAGLRDTLWRGKAESCGKIYNVTCIGGANLAPHPCKPGTSVVVKIVDYCRPICNGDINLSMDAFSQIADLNAGVVRVQYEPVDPL